MRLRNALAISVTAAAALTGTSGAAADESEPRGRQGHAALSVANQPVCGDRVGADFPVDTRIHGGPAEYRPGGGAQLWYVDLTNTTAHTCRNIHPVVVLVDRDRTLKDSQAKLEFYDAVGGGGRPRPVPFERTDADEHIGVFDDGFPGFVIGAGETVTVKVRLGFTADTRPNEVTANAAVVQRRGTTGSGSGSPGATGSASARRRRPRSSRGRRSWRTRVLARLRPRPSSARWFSGAWRCSSGRGGCGGAEGAAPMALATCNDPPRGLPERPSPGAPIRSGIPEHGRIPKYYAVKAQVAALIDELGEGGLLPTERDLAERYEVARETVRQALRELLLEGRLRRQGRGTVVAGPKLEQPLSLASYTEGVRRQGRRPGRHLISLDRFPCPPALAAETGLERGEPVWHMERVLLADDERMGLESTYVAVARVPRLDSEFTPDSSFYAYLHDRLCIAFGDADERIETVLATPREALLIGTPPALPMLLIHRVSRDTAGLPLNAYAPSTGATGSPSPPTSGTEAIEGT